MPKHDELWVNWTHDAMKRYVMPEDIDNADELSDDMADIATKFADAMLEEYTDRFAAGGGAERRRRSKKNHVDEEEGGEG